MAESGLRGEYVAGPSSCQPLLAPAVPEEVAVASESEVRSRQYRYCRQSTQDVPPCRPEAVMSARVLEEAQE